jgi:hypothetical protein
MNIETTFVPPEIHQSFNKEASLEKGSAELLHTTGRILVTIWADSVWWQHCRGNVVSAGLGGGRIDIGSRLEEVGRIEEWCRIGDSGGKTGNGKAGVGDGVARGAAGNGVIGRREREGDIMARCFAKMASGFWLGLPLNIIWLAS